MVNVASTLDRGWSRMWWHSCVMSCGKRSLLYRGIDHRRHSSEYCCTHSQLIVSYYALQEWVSYILTSYIYVTISESFTNCSYNYRQLLLDQLQLQIYQLQLHITVL